MAKKISQDQINTLTGIIDNDSKTYSFEASAMVAGEKKTGSFTAKYMGVSARLRLGTIRAKLLDGAPQQSVDSLTDDIAYMIAYLTVALVKAPKWWNYDQIDDVVDLRNIYMEVFKFMQSFRGQNDGSADAGNSTTSNSKEVVEGM